MRKFYLIFICLLSLITSPLCAQPQEQKKTEAPPVFLEELHKAEEAGDQSFFREFLNMLFYLGLLVSLLLLTAWFLKRLMQSRIRRVNASNSIKVIERRPLTQKTTVYILDIMGKQVAIAESQNGITFLAEIPGEDMKKNETFAKILGEKIKKERSS